MARISRRATQATRGRGAEIMQQARQRYVGETGPREASWMGSTGEPRKQHEADSSRRQAAPVEGSQNWR
jgi:hypothetical protein